MASAYPQQQRTSVYPFARSTMVLAVAVLTGVFAIAGWALPASQAQAVTLSVDQCNGHGPSAEGATTGMNCTVTIVNTITGAATSSTTTVTRTCTLGPCSSPNGTFTTHSTSLVTSVNQCNGSDNDAAHPITCVVTITNNISANTQGAGPVNAATVNECVGSGAGGGGTINCDPAPASTTGATITQCNGSANGGGGTVHCTVGTASAVSRAIPVTVNQCNGTGNPGGSVVTCRVSLFTNITEVTGPTPTTTGGPSSTFTPTPSSTPSTPGTPDRSQVPRTPRGGVNSGDGSTSANTVVLGDLVSAGFNA